MNSQSHRTLPFPSLHHQQKSDNMPCAQTQASKRVAHKPFSSAYSSYQKPLLQVSSHKNPARFQKPRPFVKTSLKRVSALKSSVTDYYGTSGDFYNFVTPETKAQSVLENGEFHSHSQAVGQRQAFKTLEMIGKKRAQIRQDMKKTQESSLFQSIKSRVIQRVQQGQQGGKGGAMIQQGIEQGNKRRDQMIQLRDVKGNHLGQLLQGQDGYDNMGFKIQEVNGRTNSSSNSDSSDDKCKTGNLNNKGKDKDKKWLDIGNESQDSDSFKVPKVLPPNDMSQQSLEEPSATEQNLAFPIPRIRSSHNHPRNTQRMAQTVRNQNLLYTPSFRNPLPQVQTHDQNQKKIMHNMRKSFVNLQNEAIQRVIKSNSRSFKNEYRFKHFYRNSQVDQSGFTFVYPKALPEELKATGMDINDFYQSIMQQEEIDRIQRLEWEQKQMNSQRTKRMFNKSVSSLISLQRTEITQFDQLVKAALTKSKLRKSETNEIKNQFRFKTLQKKMSFQKVDSQELLRREQKRQQLETIQKELLEQELNNKIQEESPHDSSSSQTSKKDFSHYSKNYQNKQTGKRIQHFNPYSTSSPFNQPGSHSRHHTLVPKSTQRKDTSCQGSRRTCQTGPFPRDKFSMKEVVSVQPYRSYWLRCIDNCLKTEDCFQLQFEVGYYSVLRPRKLRNQMINAQDFCMLDLADQDVFRMGSRFIGKLDFDLMRRDHELVQGLFDKEVYDEIISQWKKHVQDEQDKKLERERKSIQINKLQMEKQQQQIQQKQRKMLKQQQKQEKQLLKQQIKEEKLLNSSRRQSIIQSRNQSRRQSNTSQISLTIDPQPQKNQDQINLNPNTQNKQFFTQANQPSSPLRQQHHRQEPDAQKPQFGLHKSHFNLSGANKISHLVPQLDLGQQHNIAQITFPSSRGVTTEETVEDSTHIDELLQCMRVEECLRHLEIMGAVDRLIYKFREFKLPVYLSNHKGDNDGQDQEDGEEEEEEEGEGVQNYKEEEEGDEEGDDEESE